MKKGTIIKVETGTGTINGKIMAIELTKVKGWVVDYMDIATGKLRWCRLSQIVG